MHLNQRITTHRAMAKAEGNLAEGLLGAIPRAGLLGTTSVQLKIATPQHSSGCGLRGAAGV